MNKKFITNPDELEAIHADLGERETTVNIPEGKSAKVEIFTSDNTMLTKLKKNMTLNPEEWKCWEGTRNAEGQVTGYFFETKRSLIAFKAKKKSSNLTEEQRKAIGARFREGKKAKEETV